ncbi:MAG TPA: hypothetical protein VGQ20_10560 [Acidimicrobiales bacterium]|jgi:uncharacterized protein (TIGR03086 family)|nr:hypothetical protein [Acidimicrobiales bacterium]
MDVAAARGYFARPLPPAFQRRVVTIDPGGERRYVHAEWRDAIVLVERGTVELEGVSGRRFRFGRGAILCLVDVPLRALHNVGPEPVALVAIARRRGRVDAYRGRSMDEPAVFVLADRALERVIAQIADDQWEMRMPADFLTAAADHTPTLREVVNYHAYDDSWVPDMLAGKTMDEAGRTKFDGDLLGDDPRAAFATIVDRACAAAGQIDDLDRVVHCSFGDFTAREYFWQINSFRGLRAHDIAKAVGRDPTLPPELVEALWEEISPHAEEWRALGVYPPAVQVPDDAPLQARLLGLTGRRPS